MKRVNHIERNRYQDSVTLMQAAVRLREIEGIAEASLMMGSEPNKAILAEAGMLTEEGQSAGPNDLILALLGSEEGIDTAIDRMRNGEFGTRNDSELLQHSAFRIPHLRPSSFAFSLSAGL